MSEIPAPPGGRFATGRRVLSRLVPSMLGLAAVASVLLLLIGLFAHATTGGSTLVSPRTSTSSLTTPQARQTATTDVGAATTPPTTAPQTTAAPAESTPRATTPPATVDVVVLNSTGVTGLAGRVSDFLATQGWHVRTLGNFTPQLDVSTIYYPPGYLAEARALAPLIPGSDADQTREATDGLAPDAVTVVLGVDSAQWTAPT